MKKVITISSLLLGAVFLSGCSQQTVSKTQPITPVAQNPTTNQSSATSIKKEAKNDSSCGSQVKDKSGITYGTVLAEDGKCWLDRNLGATEVATSSTDEAAYGWYFQWGRSADGHQIPTSETTSTRSSSDKPGNAKFIVTTGRPYDWRSPQNDNFWQGVDGKNNPCPVGFRLPTNTEWESLVSSAKIENSATAFSSSLKLAAAGNRYIDGTLGSQGSDGYYWSSSPSSAYAYILDFDSTGVYPAGYYNRVVGLSVRCLNN